MLQWLNIFPTTPGRIVLSLGLATVFVLTSLVADIIGRPLHEATMNTIGTFIFGMMGLDVAQFFGKRFSDYGYAAAKASGQTPPPAKDVGERGNE